jgi:hypothetical protein
MKKLQKGFVIPLVIAVIALLVIGGGAYFYSNKDKKINQNNPQVVNGPIYDEKCRSDGSDLAILCELRNAYENNSKMAIIRLQGSLSDYYEKNKPDIKTLADQIVSNDRPVDYRVFLVHLLQNRSARQIWTETDFSMVRNDLLNVISNNKNSEKIRAEMIISLPSIYRYIKIKDNTDLFEKLVVVLNSGSDILSSATVGSLAGGGADLNLSRVKTELMNFINNYKTNYKERPEALIRALTTLKSNRESSPEITSATNFVCIQNDSRATMLCK